MTKNRTDTPTFEQLVRRYALTGAGLGLYFGWFFRPVREPNLFVVLGLSALSALVTVALARYRGQRDPAALLRKLAVAFVQYGLALLVLEGRHLAYDWGGRSATIVMTTLLGAVAGAWWGYAQGRSTP